MKIVLTERDRTLVSDLVLSRVMSRDQIQCLYFGSTTRANTRLRQLASLSLVKRIETPFYGQSLYIAGRKASEVVSERIRGSIVRQLRSPRFLVHSLSVNNVRLALREKGLRDWRFELQISHSFHFGKHFDIRPDGMVLADPLPILVEVDLGHIAPEKVKAKLAAYRAFSQSGECERAYHTPSFRLLFVTTGPDRSRTIRRLLPHDPGFEFACNTFDELGIARISNWS